MLARLNRRVSSIVRTTRLAGPAWVSAQAAQIRQRELEAQDHEYEERLAKARKAEARLRALANARVTKRQVWQLAVEFTISNIKYSALLRGPHKHLTSKTKKCIFLTVKWMKQKTIFHPPFVN